MAHHHHHHMTLTFNIKVIEAKDLPKVDTFGKVDPYVQIQLGNEKCKTKVIKKSYNPVWNETFSIPVTNPKAPLNITVVDYDFIGSNDAFAYIHFNQQEFNVGQVVDKWYMLNSYKAGRSAGQIHLVIHLATQNMKPFE
uniref:XYPPX repeat family protein n=1 Tax=Trichomonas vaginalis (strain ATCC PRA-98 / G3) TaxID=412133 RepID=UPI0031B8B3B2